MAIQTVESLREHLEIAIQVELSTIPPYLYAMYSIENQMSDAALLIRSVVVEEMLHAALVSNILLAIGGEPDFDSASYIPSYPGYLPHHRPPLLLELKKASVDHIRETFLVIERPEAPGAQPEDDEYETLGQFYVAVEQAIDALSAEQDIFANPQVERQMGDPSWYAPVRFDAADSGGLLSVTDHASAIEAIEIIVHQGEGLSDELWADPSHQELTHYHKFLQICDGTSPLGTVREVMENPSTSMYPNEIQPVSDLFNAGYRLLYLSLANLFRGIDQAASVGSLYSIMSGVLSPVAHYLTTLKVDGGVAAPTFEVYEFGSDNPLQHARRLADSVILAHPALGPVGVVLAGLDARSLEPSSTHA